VGERSGPVPLGLGGVPLPDPAPAGERAARGRLEPVDPPSAEARVLPSAEARVLPSAEARVPPSAEARVPPFEEALDELQRIVAQLEGGELGLDAALGLYERGVALVRTCGAQLDRAEARLQALSVDAAGRPVLRPVEEPGA